MRIDIFGSKVALTTAIQQYVEEKAGKLENFLKRFPADSLLLRFEVGKTTEHHEKGKIFRAEAHLTLPQRDLYAEGVEEDLYAAIDVVVDELKRQIRDDKERMLAERRRQRR